MPGHVSQGLFHSYEVRCHLVNRARNDVLHKNKLKGKLFSIASPPTTESPGRDHFKQLPTPGPEGLELSLWLPEGVVTSLIELCMNDILENRKPLFPG